MESTTTDELVVRPLAGVWSRIAGRFIDLLLVNAVFIAGAAAGSFWLVVGIVVGVVWELLWLVQRGATPGKLLMGTQVVTPTGAAIGAGKAALRTLDSAVLGAVAAVSLGASLYGRLYFATSLILLAIDTQRRRSLMDYVAGTRVVAIDDSAS